MLDWVAYFGPGFNRVVIQITRGFWEGRCIAESDKSHIWSITSLHLGLRRVEVGAATYVTANLLVLVDEALVRNCAGERVQ